MIAGLENEDILILRFFVVEDLIDLKGHCLTRPHIRDFAEPAICVHVSVIFEFDVVIFLRWQCALPLMVGWVISDMARRMKILPFT